MLFSATTLKFQIRGGCSGGSDGSFRSVSVAVRRHHHHGKSYKGKHLTEVSAHSSEVQSTIIMVGSTVTEVWLPAGRLGASYVLIRRQQEVNSDTG